MRSFYTDEDWKRFQINYSKIESLALTTKDENGNQILWDTLEMKTKISNDMRLTNHDTRFNRIMDPAIYLAAQLKFVEDKNVLDLLWEFYRYDEYHYDAEIYEKKIIDYCNEYACSYIIAIFYIVVQHNKFKANYYFPIPLNILYSHGMNMRWARLDRANNLYYIEPTYTIPTKEDLKSSLEFFKTGCKRTDD